MSRACKRKKEKSGEKSNRLLFDRKVKKKNGVLERKRKNHIKHIA
tara:strand:+ start:62 stop:196 length:135 start_codon:yes stop_codon:yes gene_type:complete